MRKIKMDNLWIIISKSCSDCNTMGAKLFDKEPTKKEIDEVEKELGGMYCISSHVSKIEIGKLVSFEQK